MPYRILGIAVHKKMLAVVVSDVEVDGEHRFERRMFGSNPEQLRSPAAWLLEQEVEEVVLQPPLSQGQLSYATYTQSGGQRRSQKPRKHLRDRVPPLSPAPGT